MKRSCCGVFFDKEIKSSFISFKEHEEKKKRNC
jgi:hypothetical protein